jgi:hypothetical protein
MSEIARKEFAEMCGDGVQSINKWIERGKVITVDGNKKLIDTENPVNVLFLQQRQDAHAQKQLLGDGVKINTQRPKDVGIVIDTELPKKAAKKVIEKPVKVKSVKKEPVEPTITPEMKLAEALRVEEQHNRAKIKIDQEAQIRQQNIDLTELRIQSEKIRLDKTAGNLLPIDLGMGVIERHANSILKTFEKGFERIADIYASVAGMDPATRTEFIKECRIELSHCVELAGKSAEAEIDILVDNYAETLMTGQKKA